jgi:GH43 family beta-xylosidase
MDLRAAAWRPLHPEPIDQGDPYVLRIPDGIDAAYRYYAYCSGEGGHETDAFPVYGSNDLVRWRRFPRNALRADLTRAFWAPCVRYVPHLERPYVMLYSHSVGLDTEAHIGHCIYRADSGRPEGPFVFSGENLTPQLDFAIDPDLFRTPDGRLVMAFATDFITGPPLGTGLAVAEIDEDLTALKAGFQVLARASADWQVYDPARVMVWKQIPGVDWAKDRVRWYTMEGPAGGIVSPGGKAVVLYSGGCYFEFYAVGALVEVPGPVTSGAARADASHSQQPLPAFVDLAADGRTFVLQPHPEAGIFGPGHCSVVEGPDGETVVVFHARFGSPDAPRQLALAVLEWRDDVPFCAPPRPLT